MRDFNKIRIIISTSDKTSYILKAFCHQADKHLMDSKISIAGYSIFPNLPSRYELISLAPVQNNMKEWTRNLFKYVSSLTEDYVIFGLDDFLPACKVNHEIFDEVFKIVQDRGAVRYELGIGHQWHKSKIVLESTQLYDIYEYKQDALYRISTQFSLWNREYLLKFLDHDWDPWQFEVEGSRLAENDGNLIIGTDRAYSFDWVRMGALSGRHPDKVNIDGLTVPDIEELIEIGIFDRTKLQYGMHIENNKPYVFS